MIIIVNITYFMSFKLLNLHLPSQYASAFPTLRRTLHTTCSCCPSFSIPGQWWYTCFDCQFYLPTYISHSLFSLSSNLVLLSISIFCRFRFQHHSFFLRITHHTLKKKKKNRPVTLCPCRFINFHAPVISFIFMPLSFIIYCTVWTPGRCSTLRCSLIFFYIFF